MKQGGRCSILPEDSRAARGETARPAHSPCPYPRSSFRPSGHFGRPTCQPYPRLTPTILCPKAKQSSSILTFPTHGKSRPPYLQPLGRRHPRPSCSPLAWTATLPRWGHLLTPQPWPLKSVLHSSARRCRTIFLRPHPHPTRLLGLHQILSAIQAF